MELLKSLSEISQQTMQQFQEAARKEMDPEKLGRALSKAGIATGLGLTAYDLQAPSKHLFPVNTPLLNSIPRVPGDGDTATRWKAITGINTGHLRAGVPEGYRNGVVVTDTVNKQAAYATLGLEDFVTIQAERAGKGFEDLRATSAQNLLWALKIEQELLTFGGNASLALGIPAAPVVSVVDGGGTIPDAPAGYNVIVVALAHLGLEAASLTSGVPGLVTVTTADNKTFTYGGGSSQKSPATGTGAIANGGDSIIQAYVTPVNGAVGYAWFVGAAGSEKLEAITTINSVSLTALDGTHQALSTTFDSDHSVYAYGYDGLLYQAMAAGSNAYIKTLATGTPGTGTSLTADGKGGIVEFDEVLLHMWNTLRLSPTQIIVSARDIQTITNRILNSSNVKYDFIVDNSGSGMSNVIGGATVKAYTNKFAMAGQSAQIAINIHPNAAPGTILFYTDQLPYVLTNVKNVVEYKAQLDYHQLEWPMRSLQYETGVYVIETLCHYYPPSLGIIRNVAADA